jgi:hypothetical protein
MNELPVTIEKSYAASVRPDAKLKDHLIFATSLMVHGCFRHAKSVLDTLGGGSGAWWRWMVDRCVELADGESLVKTVLTTDDPQDTVPLPDGTIIQGSTNVMVARKGACCRKLVIMFGGAPQPSFFGSGNSALACQCDDAHFVFMRDRRDRAKPEFGYLTGVAGLGSDYRECLRNLKTLIATLGAPDLYCVGHSLGGYAALRYGLDLEAGAVLSLSGYTTFDPDDYTGLLRSRAEAPAQLSTIAPEMGVDVVKLYEAATRRPKATLLYGEKNLVDAAFAYRMSHLTDACLHPVKGTDAHFVPGLEPFVRQMLSA